MAYLQRGLVGPFIHIKFYSLTLSFFITIHALFSEDLMKMNEKHPISHCSRRWGKIYWICPFFSRSSPSPANEVYSGPGPVLHPSLTDQSTNQQTDTDEDIFFLAERINQSQRVCRIVIYPLSKLVNPSGRIKICIVADSNHAKHGLGWGKGLAIMPKVPGIFSRGTTFQVPITCCFLTLMTLMIIIGPIVTCFLLLQMSICQRTMNKIRLVCSVRFLNMIWIHDH